MTKPELLDEIAASVAADLADRAGFGIPTRRARFRDYAQTEIRNALDRAIADDGEQARMTEKDGI